MHLRSTKLLEADAATAVAPSARQSLTPQTSDIFSLRYNCRIRFIPLQGINIDLLSCTERLYIRWLNVQPQTENCGLLWTDVWSWIKRLYCLWNLTPREWCVYLRLTTSSGYTFFEDAHKSEFGGSVIIFNHSYFWCTALQLPSTFESICYRLTSPAESIVLLAVYRVDYAHPSAQFFDDLASVLEVLVVQQNPVVIGGDFNIHADDGYPCLEIVSYKAAELQRFLDNQKLRE